MAKGRYSKTAGVSKTAAKSSRHRSAGSREIKIRRRAFNVSESSRKPTQKMALGGTGFQIREGAWNVNAEADVSMSNSGDFFSPLFPTDLLEKPATVEQGRAYHRHFYRKDPYVGRAIDLHCDIPISKIRLKMSDCKDKDRSSKILKFYEEMCRRILLQKRLREIAHEYWLLGYAWPFHEWDDDNKVWSSISILNPDTLKVDTVPYTDYIKVEIIPTSEDRSTLERADAAEASEDIREALDQIPDDIREQIREQQNIPLDTDPFEGSFVHHLVRRKSFYEEEGISILERIMDTLLYREKLRQAQSQIATRSMTPKNLVWGEGLSTDDVNNLREQVDLAIADPDFSIISNYEVHWDQIGAQGRLLPLDNEYSHTEKLISIGLGVTVELLTGEGSFTGNRIGLEVMNNVYMAFRDDISEYVEDSIFRPVAVANDFYEMDEDGNRHYIYPRLTFTRLALRDNSDTFDQLFNLYQKGSLDVSVILDLLNIDPVDTKDRVERDTMTVNDSAFSEITRALYGEVGRLLAERTDAIKVIAKRLGLTLEEPPEGAEGGGGGGGGGGLSDLGGGGGGGESGGDCGNSSDIWC